MSLMRIIFLFAAMFFFFEFVLRQLAKPIGTASFFTHASVRIRLRPKNKPAFDGRVLRPDDIRPCTRKLIRPILRAAKAAAPDILHGSYRRRTPQSPASSHTAPIQALRYNINSERSCQELFRLFARIFKIIFVEVFSPPPPCVQSARRGAQAAPKPLTRGGS